MICREAPIFVVANKLGRWLLARSRLDKNGRGLFSSRRREFHRRQPADVLRSEPVSVLFPLSVRALSRGYNVLVAQVARRDGPRRSVSGTDPRSGGWLG
jgi:hypothetical protein